MDTHAHQLHNAPGKNFWHYLFEFFMLFLAVFCGFVAENIRERKVEMARERELVRSLVADLKVDIKNVGSTIRYYQASVLMMDTLLTLLNDPQLARKNGDAIYYTARMGPRVVTFVSNSRTFDQLKNSGGFRLIHDLDASNMIMDYYALFPMLDLFEDGAVKEFEDYKCVASKIFDPMIFRQNENADGIIIRGSNNPPLRTYDAELIKQLGIYIVYINGSRRSITRVLENIRKKGEALIIYLQDRYHLK